MGKKERIMQIAEIAKRAEEELGMLRITVIMDLDNADKTTPLDLDRLMEFDEYNFAHDILGINRNLNHRTCELENCFLPRCAL